MRAGFNLSPARSLLNARICFADGHELYTASTAPWLPDVTIAV